MSAPVKRESVPSGSPPRKRGRDIPDSEDGKLPPPHNTLCPPPPKRPKPPSKPCFRTILESMDRRMRNMEHRQSTQGDNDADPNQGRSQLLATSPLRAEERDAINQIATKCHLTQNNREFLLYLGTLDPKLVQIHAIALLLEDRERREENLDYLKAEWFKAGIIPKLRTLMMSPKLQAYVTGLLEYLTSDMAAKPATWGIPAEIFTDPRKTSAFTSAVSHVLTEWRSKTKGKIQDSIAKKENVYSLAQRITGKEVVLTVAHYRRFAFLRMVSARTQNPQEDPLRLNLNPDDAEEDTPNEMPAIEPVHIIKGGFWRNVDHSLMNLRGPKQNDGARTSQETEEQLLNKFLKLDLKIYRPDSEETEPATKNSLPWQNALDEVIEGFECNSLDTVNDNQGDGE